MTVREKAFIYSVWKSVECSESLSALTHSEETLFGVLTDEPLWVPPL